MAIEWRTERRKIADLTDYPHNPRTFTEKGMADLMASMKAVGYIDPIAINTDGTIIGGHARRKTLIEMGLTEIDVRVPDRKLSDKEVQQAVIRLNRNTAGTWNYQMLEDEFGQAELIEWGFEKSEFNAFGKKPDARADEVPPTPSAAVTRRGDQWILGAHTLRCGNATMEADVQALLQKITPDLVFTDPPYGVNIVNIKSKKVSGNAATKFKGTGTVGGRKIVDAKQYAAIIGDDTTDAARDFYKLCIKRGIKNFIIFGGNYFTDFLPPRACWLIWDKQNTGNFAQVEMAWTSYTGGAKLYPFLWNGLSREGDRKTELSTRIHPTQKPVGLFEAMFQDFKFDTCFDGFMGSGSTLIACEKTGKTCYGMELSPEYCDVIIQRWQNFTGKKAMHAVTKEYFSDIMKTSTPAKKAKKK